MSDKTTRKYNNAIYDFQKVIENSPYWGFLMLEQQTFHEDDTLSQEVLAKLIKGKKAPKNFDEDYYLDNIMTSIIANFFVKKGMSRDEAKIYLDADQINNWINQAYDFDEDDNVFDLDELDDLKDY